MKIIEAMKQVKDQLDKATDLRDKIAKFAADMDFETPTYENQKAQVFEWLQAHHDIVKNIEHLRVSIQRTNLATNVDIKIGEQVVTKSIASWVYRRRDLATLEGAAWGMLGNKERSGGLRDGMMGTSSGDQREVHIRRYYDPKERDQKMEEYRAEPSLIDATLEVVNAVTDLKEQ